MDLINTYGALLSKVDARIKNAISLLPKSTIAKVVAVKKNTVKVASVELSLNQQAFLNDVPIIRPIYNHYPVKVGDLGILLTCDYAVSQFVKNSQLNKKKLQRNTNGGGYLFFPIASNDNDFASDTMANEMYSLDGKTFLSIDNEQVKIKDKFENEIIINSDGINITDSNKNKIEFTSSGININGNLEILQ